MRPSIIIRLLGPLIFLAGAVSSLFWFGYSLTTLFANIDSEIVLFDKGACYLFGAGLGLSILTFVLVYEFWYGKPLSDKLSKMCTRLAFLSIVVLLVLPHVCHYITGNYLGSKGYIVCEKASTQWLFTKEIVYINETQDCGEIAKEILKNPR